MALRGQIPDHSYRMWIDPLEYVGIEKGHVVLNCPNTFSQKRIKDQYSSMICKALTRLSGHPVQLKLRPTGRNGNTVAKPRYEQQMCLPQLNLRLPNGRRLRRQFTFEQFVVGSNNDFAYSAALSMAAQRKNTQSSLFLLSATGLGKSHLSQAIGNYIVSQFPTERVYYITAQDFCNEMIDAFKHNGLHAFKEKYRQNCDVLLLEDVHYLTGKERTQIELASTLDLLFEGDKKVIFSSCYLPADIPKLSDKLRSRLSCCVITNIEPPDFQTRVRILERKAVATGFPIPKEVIQYLAGELVDNVRQLESGLIGITAKASLLGNPIDLNLAQSVVETIVRERREITLDTIKKTVSKHFQISVKDLVSRSRKQKIVRPRQIAMYLSRHYTDQPLQAIGKSFNRYHATALHAIGVVEEGIKTNNAIKQQVQYLSRRLENGKV